MKKDITLPALIELGVEFFDLDESGKTISVPINKFMQKNTDLYYGENGKDRLAVLFLPKSNKIHVIFRVEKKDEQEESSIFLVYHNEVEI